MWPDKIWKVAHRCGAKHISKSKCTKYTRFRVQSTFGSWVVEKVHTVVARSTFPSRNVENTSRWKAMAKGAKKVGKSRTIFLAVKSGGRNHQNTRAFCVERPKNQLPGKPSRHKKTWHWKKSPGNSACAWKLQISFLEHLKPWLNSLNIFTLA